jgi:exonuclease SbcC
MKLRSISLHFFRQHISTQVTFPDGLIGIIGSNGSGKTTIVEAIGFALFGSRVLRGRVEEVRTRTAPAKSGRGKREAEPRVVLSVEHDTVLYRIERTLTDASLYVGGEPQPVATGNRDVSARVSSLVGMSYEEFLATYCTEQKGLEFLSGKKGATEREKFIVRMMGYDRLEKLQELLRSDRKEKRVVVSAVEASLGTREELEQRLAAEQEELFQVRQKHDEASKVLQRAEGDFSTLRAKMTKLEDLRSKVTREREAIQTLGVRLEERERRMRSLAENKGRAETELQQALKGLVVSGATLEESVAALKGRLAADKEKVAAALEAKRVAEGSWREGVVQLQAEKEAVERQLKTLIAKSSKIGELKAGSDCPTCGQELGESFEGVKKHFTLEQRALQKRIKELEGQVATRSEIPAEFAAMDAQRREHEHAIAHTEAKLQELQVCVQLEGKLAELEKEQSTLVGDVNALKENLLRAQERLSQIPFSDDEYAKEKGAHDAAQRLVEVSRLQRVRLEGEVNTKEALVKRSQDELERYDERRIELDRSRREVRILDECDRIVSDFRRSVNTSIRPRMAELASEYLADLTDGRYTAVELEEDFTPTVLDEGEAKGVISGGEEDILNLCMRISLSHMLAERAGQHFSLLMLDEVFGSLDDVRRGNVLALLEKLRKRFEQIIIITHLDDIKDGVQHLIHVEYDEAQGSSVVHAARDTLSFVGDDVVNV